MKLALEQEKQDIGGPFVEAALIALLFIAAVFFWLGRDGLNLWDEGFLWYGTQRVMAGEVPLRDFMSYDPGRYYWAATLMSALGNDGIVCLRAAASIFQFFGLFCGLYLVALSWTGRRGWRKGFLLIVAFILVLWMFPRHKIFDISISIFLVGIVARLVSARTTSQFFLAGAGVGLVAFFGRNHGLYGLVASFMAMVWLNVGAERMKAPVKAVGAWCVGVVSGYSPMLLLIALVPGFWGAFADGLRFQLSRGQTNLPLSIPWPWRMDLSVFSWATVCGVLLGCLFVALIVFGVLSLAWIFFARLKGRRVPAVFAGAAFMVLPYAHYAYSRADVGHLAQGIFPLLLGCLLLISCRRTVLGGILLSVLAFASVAVGGVNQSGWSCKEGGCRKLVVGGDELYVDDATAKNVELITDLAGQYSGHGRAFVAMPYWPGAYALLGLRSPLWANYALWSRGIDFEKKEVERMKEANPGVVIVDEIPLDGRDDLRFSHTNPYIYKYVEDTFHRLPSVDARCPSCRIYVAKDFYKGE